MRLYLTAFLLFLFGPIAVIVLFSFHSSPALIFPFQGFSLQWYGKLFANAAFRSSFWNSLQVGVATTIITTVLGSLTALALIRMGRRSKIVVEVLSLAPIGLPGLFLGVALLTLFARIGLPRSLVTITIGHVLFTLPFFVEAMRSRITYFDFTLEEAARDLGASPWQVFSRVTLPILAPTIMGGAMLTFALSFDEFIITIFVGGNDTTLPLFIWSLMRRSIEPTINAVSVITLLLSLAALALAGLMLLAQRRRTAIARTPLFED
ncbi:MAG: polyamine ABC transporter permease [Rhizobiales bacterium]|nr:polyamine ABC transporter permease [Hyphomicrobiales bacterium]MBA70689.1 polyamine ABC transporter permease [Hyphomicrobiales bacterium]|tara:strand:- start:874 stop:1665 length:792 start_codon:yes stop_codon:yes gene_type:complete